MSEKATLLTSIPPVKRQGVEDSSSQLLSSNLTVPEIEPKESDENVSLLSQTRDVESVDQKPATNVQTAGVETAGVETVASEVAVEEPLSISAFQMLTYASFVLNFLLAGAAAIILFKKAAKLTEERFVVSLKALAIAGVLIMLHGLFAADLYAAHLNNTVSSAPLFVTMAVWILLGPVVGFITRNLLARKDKPNRTGALIDAGIYGIIFFLAACGVSSGIKTNAALLASIIAGFLMIVPIARSLSAFKVAKARHQELKRTSDQILIYGLLFIPALIPLLAFAHICGLSDGITLFLVNFITFDFMIVVGLAMMASADEIILGEANQELAEVEAQTPAPAVVETPAPAAVEAPSAPGPSPAKVGAGNLNDPIIQFLNSEEGIAKKSAAPFRAAAKSAPRTLPPRKPGRPSVTPPAKSGDAPVSSAPNAPSRLKAPAKPKKRI
jgi:hypothetical protein